MVLLPPTTIGAAGTVLSVPVKGLRNMAYLCAQGTFLYGAGGTTCNAYIQTSIDGGLTWMDIINFSYGVAAATKVSAVAVNVALAAVTVPTDGTLAANTIVSGLFGAMLRVKVISTGTYTGLTSLAVYANPIATAAP